MIVNTASIAGKRPQGFLGRLLGHQGGRDRAHRGDRCKELAGDGVRCTAICPAFVDTADDGLGQGPGRRPTT